jgi:hypothetical protein
MKHNTENLSSSDFPCGAGRLDHYECYKGKLMMHMYSELMEPLVSPRLQQGWAVHSRHIFFLDASE